MSEENVIVLRAFHITIRALLVLAGAFWLLVCLEIFPPMVMSGLGAAREKLVHIWSMGRADLAWSCQNSLELLHEGYTDLILFLLLTWALLETKRYLSRLIAAR